MALRRLALKMKDSAVKASVMTIITAMTPPSLKCSCSIPVTHISGQKPRKVAEA